VAASAADAPQTAHAFEHPTGDARFERADVCGDIRKFRHGLRILPSNVRVPLMDTVEVERAAEALRRAARVFVLTGAGMGVASGLKTFRSDGGYWREKPVAALASRAGFESDPAFCWSWYNERVAAYAAAEPNAGHRALVALGQRLPQFFLATQNVEGLQTRAGSRELVELHGDLRTVRCTGCAYREPLAGPLDLARIAHACGGKLRPNVVWFGESLPPGAWELAERASAAADVIIVAGTSLAVYPAASLARVGEGGVTVIEVNPDAAGGPNVLALRTGTEIALPALLAALQGI
jgi:NAD-dependent deacetylase